MGKSYFFCRECVFYFPSDRARGRANKLKAKFLNGDRLGLRLGPTRCASALRRVLSEPQRSSVRQVPNVLSGMCLNAVGSAPRKPTPGAQLDGDEVPSSKVSHSRRRWSPATQRWHQSRVSCMVEPIRTLRFVLLGHTLRPTTRNTHD